MKTSSSFLLPDRHITLLYPTLHHPDLSLFYPPPYLYPSHFTSLFIRSYPTTPFHSNLMSCQVILSHLLHSNSILLSPWPPHPSSHNQRQLHSHHTSTKPNFTYLTVLVRLLVRAYVHLSTASHTIPTFEVALLHSSAYFLLLLIMIRACLNITTKPDRFQNYVLSFFQFQSPKHPHTPPLSTIYT